MTHEVSCLLYMKYQLQEVEIINCETMIHINALIIIYYETVKLVIFYDSPTRDLNTNW